MTDQTAIHDGQRFIVVRPDPDATPASTALVVREISAIREQNELRSEAIRTRFDAMDKAVTLFSDNLTRVPTDVQREIVHLRALMEQTINGKLDAAYRELIARLEGMDSAVQLVQAYRSTLPSEVDNKMLRQKELLSDMLTGAIAEIDMHFEVQETHFRILEEKFAGIGIQFSGRDTALAAALQAAKEAVGEQTKTSKENIDKSERNMLEAIKQQRDLLQTNYRSLDDKITLFDKTNRDLLQAFDVRLTRFEGQLLGASTNKLETRDEHNSSRSSSQYTAYLIFGAVGVLMGTAGFVVAILKP